MVTSQCGECSICLYASLSSTPWGITAYNLVNLPHWPPDPTMDYVDVTTSSITVWLHRIHTCLLFTTKSAWVTCWSPVKASAHKALTFSLPPQFYRINIMPDVSPLPVRPVRLSDLFLWEAVRNCFCMCRWLLSYFRCISSDEHNRINCIS